MNDPQSFESRKKDHIRIAVSDRAQAEKNRRFDQIQFEHQALPEINFADVNLTQSALNRPLKTPFFVSSMTAGHFDGEQLNLRIALACERKNWPMGVGSQRRELTDPQASKEWATLREKAPKTDFLGNIGLSQLIATPAEKISSLVESLQPIALFIHTNPLQEALQAEGTPQFKGGLAAIEATCKTLNVPVILKEVGCGFSAATLNSLKNTGLYAVDVAGNGGTHWGRVEGLRNPEASALYRASETFQNWGIDTVTALLEAQSVELPFKIWASGGIRSGLDAAKCVTLGAEMVGVAKPIMEAALVSQDAIVDLMELFEFELRTAMFCTGSASLAELAQQNLTLSPLREQ